MHITEADRQLLEREIPYLGASISVRELESTIQGERRLQDEQVQELNGLRQRNEELQGALAGEMERLRELSEHLQRERERGGFMMSLRDVFAKMPWFQGRIITRRSIEEMLRAQYELSARRVREASEFADRLEVAQVELFDEIERLNVKIVESAKNEELAREHIKAVQRLKRRLEMVRGRKDVSSAQARELQADVDRATRVLARHGGLLKLYSTAEARLVALQDNTRLLSETIAYLRDDILLYVTAASEKIDVIAGQIQAIGAAADAAVVMLELKHSLEALTEAVNQTSRFVAETQSYFRQNVDQMVEELTLYDEETVLVFEENQAFNRLFDEAQQADLMTDALAMEIEALAERAAQESAEEKVVLGVEVEAEVQDER